MASIRLIAQYPNVGNSGHIFFVPAGQKEYSLGIGEKINTQMLSIIHANSVEYYDNLDKLFHSSLIKGNDFLAVSIPIKQVLKEKSSDRVSHVWIAIEGFDVTANESLISKLHLELQSLIPKVEAVALNLGHLDQNADRYIEIKEMVEWAKNPFFKGIKFLSKPKQRNSLSKWMQSLKVVSTIPPWIMRISFMVIVIACAFWLSPIQYSGVKICSEQKQDPKPNHVVPNDLISELRKVCGEVDENHIKEALDFFGITRNDFENAVLNKNWQQPDGKFDNFIDAKRIDKILDIIKDDTFDRIDLQGDEFIKLAISNMSIYEASADGVKVKVAVINIFLEKLRSLKCNKIVLLLIKKKRWRVDGKFVIDFVRNTDIVILKNQGGNADSSFENLDDIMKKSNGLSKGFENLIKDAKCVGKRTRDWCSFDDINRRIKMCISELNKP